MRKISLIGLLLLALAVPTLAGGATKDVQLALVAYSTPKTAFSKLIPAFQKTSAGQGVTFTQSYGPSTTQANAIVAGLPTDIAYLSLTPDIDTLVQHDLVSPSWDKNKWHGIVTKSIVVFVVRSGNPKHIRTWSDLLKPGVQVVTPNPFTSGGARWNTMAAYGGALRAGKSPKQAIAYLTALYRQHVVAQPSSAALALTTFLSGKGDVLLSYENEAILAQQQGHAINWVAPKATILIQNPIAVTSTSQHQATAKAFVNWLYTPQAQTLFASTGYRPVLKSVAKQFHFTNPKLLFTIGYVGGWDKVEKTFFDPQSGVMAKIEQGLGG